MGKHRDSSNPWGTDNPPPADRATTEAARRLVARRGYPLQDGESILPWWPYSEKGD